jgi:hypothetical protein
MIGLAGGSAISRVGHRQRGRLPQGALDLVAPLARFVPPALILDKPAHSAFAGSGLAAMLLQKDISAVVITGSETDVCVLSSILSAVRSRLQRHCRRGRALQSSDAGHDALMTLYRARFTDQIELMNIEEVCALARLGLARAFRLARWPWRILTTPQAFVNSASVIASVKPGLDANARR